MKRSNCLSTFTLFLFKQGEGVSSDASDTTEYAVYPSHRHTHKHTRSHSQTKGLQQILCLTHSLSVCNQSAMLTVLQKFYCDHAELCCVTKLPVTSHVYPFLIQKEISHFQCNTPESHTKLLTGCTVSIADFSF